MEKLKKTLWHWGPVLIWMGAIFLRSHVPGKKPPQFGDYEEWVNNTGHLVEYAVLTWLLRRAIGKRAWGYLITFTLALLFAVSDEWHQSFIPGRTATIRDVFMDTVGMLLALVAYWGWDKLRRRW